MKEPLVTVQLVPCSSVVLFLGLILGESVYVGGIVTEVFVEETLYNLKNNRNVFLN